MVNQKRTDLGIPNRFRLTPSRFRPSWIEKYSRSYLARLDSDRGDHFIAIRPKIILARDLRCASLSAQTSARGIGAILGPRKRLASDPSRKTNPSTTSTSPARVANNSQLPRPASGIAGAAEVAGRLVVSTASLSSEPAAKSLSTSTRRCLVCCDLS